MPESITVNEESFCDGQAEIDYIRRQLVRAVLRKDQDRALFTHTRALIKEHIKSRGETAWDFFRKNRDHFCVHLAQQMLENSPNKQLLSTNRRLSKRLSSADEPVTKSPRFDLFESWMEKLTKLLGFYESENANQAISNFVECISDCLVPVFVLCQRRYKEIAESLVDQIAEIVRLDRRSLIYKHWDDIFEKWIRMTIREPNTHDIDVYLFHWIKKNKVEYFKSKTFRSMFRALLFLSLDEHFVVSLIAHVHRFSSPGTDTAPIADNAAVHENGAGCSDRADFSLSTAIRRYFSNILFQFRNAIAAEENPERSMTATKSLEVLISRVDDGLINENAQILLIVLKSAVGATGELCISMWLKFVQKLSANVFANLASQVLVAISPLMKFDASKALFNEFFVVRATELASSTTESTKVYSILLAMIDNKAYKLGHHLPDQMSLKLSTESHFFIVKSCAELLLTGMVDLYQIVMERLLKVLEGCDLLQIDSSQLARALVFALHRTQNKELRAMIGKCVGTIGLLDLDGRTASTRRSNPIDDEANATAMTEIVSVDNKVQFTVNFIHGIFSRLDECEQSETAVKLHAVISYILLVPLKEHGMDEQIWKKLASNVVEALNASRQNPFQVDQAFKINDLFTKNIPMGGQEQQHLAIIDQSCNFQQWVRGLYFFICDKIGDPLLRTLFASLCCMKHDASILGRTMCKNIPHMIIQALVEQNDAILDKFEQEALAVFCAVVGGQICWANDAMVAICAIVDAMERFFIGRTAAAIVGTRPKDKDVLSERFDALISKILAQPNPDSLTVVPLSVLAAQKCNYHFRSLRWLEQFAASPKNGTDGDNGNFRHDFYFLLERLYSHLGNADGVLGTFQMIRNRTVPEPFEQILALKVQGNYVDALPLCQQLVGQENEIVKCLLRSNQPLLAQTFIERTLRHIEQQQHPNHENGETIGATDGENGDANAGDGAKMAAGDCSKSRRLREYQMEAVCKLGDWDQLAMLHHNLVEEGRNRNNNNGGPSQITESNAQNGGSIEKWGAKMAAIFCNLRQFDLKSFGDGIERARASLVDALERTTLEDSSTIAQAHRNIIKLRSLYEVESVRAVLYSGGDKSALLRKTIADWERQSNNSLSFAGRSERVLSLRAELLRVIDLPNTALTQCRLLLRCSELARQANYLQRSWTYIAEAKALRRMSAVMENTKQTEGAEADTAIDMEEAKYLFQKGEQFQSINLLEKTIHTNFAELCTELNALKVDIGGGSSDGSATAKRLRKSVVLQQNGEQDEGGGADIVEIAQPQQQQRRENFVEAQILLAEFNERASAKQMDDLLNTYKRLEQFGQLTESFYYRYATFYDGYCESAKEINNQMICTLLRLYRNVLDFGPLYVNHAIPRMISVWLDLAPKCAIAEAIASGTGTTAGGTARTSASKRGGKAAAAAAAAATQPHDPNREMRDAFKRLDKAYFFSSYSQMISRITHSDAATYALLKEMLSELIVHFPHRCLWLSQSIVRSTRVAVRSKRCLEIFELAKKKARSNNDNNTAVVDLNLLIQQYDYLTTLLIGIAETQIMQQRLSGLSMARLFPNIVDFFENGTMRGGVSTRGTGRLPPLGKQQSTPGASSSTATTAGRRPQILLPFIDDSMDTRCCSTATASQIRGEVFIHGVDSNFECLKSLEAPKKMAFIGTDGRTYPLLCKQNDDLCKDARFMDVNRMLNTLFMRDSETRNQLYIRCYSTIPLKEAGGGIIQWVPNLIPFASALKTVMRKKGPLMTPTELQRLLGDQTSRGDRLKAFREVCARHPLAMAQWIRTTFLDACSWYNARLAFTRTAATMSMVGFLLGLGDRHGENMLLDVRTGDLIHVDFNILFDKGEYLKVPEIVPFRLTRNMVDGFGATGVEGTFRKSCEKALKVMRAESRMLRTVLHAFAHDPLLEWTTTEARNQQYRQYGGTTLQSQQQDNANHTIGMIKMRLAGQIVTARFNPPKACAVPMSVGGQVARLIEIATDDAKLSAIVTNEQNRQKKIEKSMEMLRRWRSSLRSFALDLVRLQHPLSIPYLMAINSVFCFVALHTSREVQLRALCALIAFVIVVDFLLVDQRSCNILLGLVRWVFADFLNSFAVVLCAFSVNELHEGRERRAFFGSLFAVCAIVLAPAYSHRRVNSRIAKFAARLFQRLQHLFAVFVLRPLAVLWDWLKFIVLLRWVFVFALRLNASLLSAWDWLELRLFCPLRSLRLLFVRSLLYIVRFRWLVDLWSFVRRSFLRPMAVRLGRLLDAFVYIFGCYWLKPMLSRMGRACLDFAKFALRMFGRASYASAALLYEHVLCPLLIICADRVEQLSVWLFHLVVHPLFAIFYRRYKRVEDLALVYIVGPLLKRFLDLVPDKNPLEPASDNELDAFMPELVTESEGEALIDGDGASVPSVDRAETAADSAMDSEGFGDELDDLSSRLSSFDGDRLFASGLKRIDISESDSEVDEFLPTCKKTRRRRSRQAAT
ncbi:hypothetical protein niasHT_013661 [Heterodera trifolii]|uniref:Serine/threonine-protein kinase ATR n=1 Tax=Heterodera trifolii TaxID=157864 RepID=A0ABD2LGY2_9BILA